ncbi:CapA family protein [Bradyrhizobium sp. CAR08]
MENELSAEAAGIGEDAALSFESKVKEVLDRAKVSREWDYPVAGAATDAAEMNHVDFAYWYYKMESPTLNAEHGVSETLFSSNKSIVKLPDGFMQSSSLTFSASGDLIPMDGIEASKGILYENVSDVLFNSDISFANLEAPVTKHKFESSVIAARDPENCTLLRSSLAQFEILTRHKDQSFNVLNFATNHTFDLGIEGLETTQQLLADNKITGLGTPCSVEKFARANIVTKAGIKVGFISATFSLNNRRLPANESYRIHTARLVSRYVEPELELLTKQIEDCKSQGCDFIVASLHWGYEFEFFPRSKQLEAAHALIEQGVDLILGHHPHVIQPVEYYRTKRDPNRVAVIAYSLGGLTYGWNSAPHLELGLILNIKFTRGHLEGVSRTYIENTETIPVLQNISCENDVRLIRVQKLKEHSRVERSRQTNDCRKRVKQIQIYADLILENSGGW